MKPNEALERAIEMGGWWTLQSSLRRRKRGRPGEVIERLPELTRQALAGLTSETAETPRMDTLRLLCTDEDVELREQTRALKLEFDARLRL